MKLLLNQPPRYTWFPVKTGNGTFEDDRTVLYRTKSLDGTKPNINPNPFVSHFRV